ncbi:hypothetical protein SLEP1_g3320 [Rubroshorea leprosula]|uniref:Cyclic nucleotide-binding domain-containing protein n=1 Tax=Rubroshorea leprosula TaxID=152421 RepID=A0AAV5HK22_9ROSI|nr:hypothetical protein SLEP1_g3320 [Rubroshorea leprosula]
MEGYLFGEGDKVDRMLFIVQGKLQIFNIRNSDSKVHLKGGDFCGEELVQWVQDPKSLHLPESTKTIQAISKVEAFSLESSDLKRNWEAVHKQAVAHVISSLQKRLQERKHSLALREAKSTIP